MARAQLDILVWNTFIKNMRVVFLSSAIERIGTYWRCLFLGKYLAKEGHKVSIIATSRPSTARLIKKRVDGVNLLFLPYLSFYGHLLFGPFSRAMSVLEQTLSNCILQTINDSDVCHSFDVAWPQNAFPTLTSRLLCSLRIRNYKIFVDWDDWWGRGGMLDPYGMYPLMTPFFAMPILEFFEEKVPLHADAVTLTTEALRRRALRIGCKPDNLFMVPNGADVDFIRPLDAGEARAKLNLPRDGYIYTHAGSTSESPEIFQLLVEVHMKIVRSHPNSFLLLVGTLRPEEERLIRSLNAKNVLCVGYQPDELYPIYLAASDVLLLPLRDSIYDRARSPLRLGDYLAAGRPVVATALPEVCKIVNGCGLLAKPGSPADFADKILQIKKDPDLRERMGRTARQLAEERYSWRIIAKKLERIYAKYVS